jgi:pyruvate-formate lyase
MLSATSVALERFSSGASHIWDIAPAFANADVVRNLLEVFFKYGGQMFQGNVTDGEKLKMAQKEPESHGDLTVRVGGFSGIFVKLDRAVQDKLLVRHRHNY